MSKVIILPTDTVYGIGTPMEDFAGIERIYQIKHRDPKKAIPILFNQKEEIEKYVTLDPITFEVALSFWPGALTLIVQSSSYLEKLTGEKTLAIRMPNHPLTKKVIATYGALRVTSLNQSGEKPLFDQTVIQRNYAHLVDELYLDDTTERSEIPSTVLEFVKGVPIIHRQGAITLEQVELICKQKEKTHHKQRKK